MNLNYKSTLICALLMGCVFSSSASVILDKIKVNMSGTEQETPIGLYNNSKSPVLVQSWITGKDGKKTTDFMITPPLFRLEGNDKATVRVVRMNQNLPQNNVSDYVIHIKEVAPTDPRMKNTLSLALGTDISLIYTPEGLKEK